MQQILQEIVETNAEEEFEFPTVKKQKLNKAKVLEERLLTIFPLTLLLYLVFVF